MKTRETKRERSRSAGFTLIEMAIVLLLFGVVMSGGILGYAHMSYKMKVDETQEKFDMVFNALSTYAQRYKRLPCPSDPNGGGVERGGGDCFDNSSLNALYASAQGVVPWRELGLPESAVRDGWGRFLTYKPAPQLTVNFLSNEMQNPDTATTSLDIHDACRSPTWFTKMDTAGGLINTHVDRTKALFCCNRAPNANYAAAFGAGAAMPAGWREQPVVAAGLVNAAGAGAATVAPANIAVMSSNAWMDEPTNAALEINGDFNVVDHGGDSNLTPDAPLMRAMGHAVTLVSHGGNGVFSFLRGNAANTRLQATVNAGGVVQAAAAGNDEILNAWPPQMIAGTSYHPKVSNAAYDPFGKRAGTSDDRVAFQRTDQIYSRLGSASCQRPANTEPLDPTCPPNGFYGDVTYVLDTSGSMSSAYNGGSLGNTRIDAAKSALNLVIPAMIDKEIEQDKDDPDMVGFNRFDPEAETLYAGRPCGVKYQTKTDIYGGAGGGFDSNSDGVIDDNDEVTEASLNGAKNRLLNTVSSSEANGWTPLAESIRKTADAMVSGGGTNGDKDEPNAIVFISDGQDTCGGDIIATAQYIARTYPHLHVHIVDVANNPSLAAMHNKFTVYENGQPVEYQMKGKYFPANNGDDLVRGLLDLGGCGSST